MSYRSTPFGRGGPGGRIEYRGGLTPPITSYASVLNSSNIADHMAHPYSPPYLDSAVVQRGLRRPGHRYFIASGGYVMPTAVDRAAMGGVLSSDFNRVNVNYLDWMINASWYEAGYPRNLGLATRVPQLKTNTTGAPGKSAMVQKPVYNRVQVVPRSRALVRTYATKAASS